MYHTKVISYNTKWELWNDKWPLLDEGRRGHSCGKIGSNLMVAGGYSYSNFDYSDSTIIIDAISGVSTQVAKMSIARAYFSLQTIQGTILAVGGVTNEGYSAVVEVFNPTSTSWTLQHPPSGLSLQTPRSAFVSVFLKDETTTTTTTATTTTITTTTPTTTTKSLTTLIYENAWKSLLFPKTTTTKTTTTTTTTTATTTTITTTTTTTKTTTTTTKTTTTTTQKTTVTTTTTTAAAATVTVVVQV